MILNKEQDIMIKSIHDIYVDTIYHGIMIYEINK